MLDATCSGGNTQARVSGRSRRWAIGSVQCAIGNRLKVKHTSAPSEMDFTRRIDLKSLEEAVA